MKMSEFYDRFWSPKAAELLKAQWAKEQADIEERRRLNPLCLADRAMDGDYLVMSLEVVPVNTDNHHLATFFNDMRASGWKLVAWNTPKVIFIKEHAK